MAFASGKNGGVTGIIEETNKSFNAKINAWQAQGNVEIFETSGYGDTDPEFEVGFGPYLSGSCTGLMTSNSGDEPGIENMTVTSGGSYGGQGSLTLTSHTGRSHTFEAVIFNIQLNHTHHGAPTGIAFQFVKTGPLTETWS